MMFDLFDGSDFQVFFEEKKYYIKHLYLPDETHLYPCPARGLAAGRPVSL